MQNRVFDIIAQIEQEKRGANRVPSHALLCDIASKATELYQLPQEELKHALNALCRAKRVRYGKTLNDMYFKTCDNGDKT